MPLLGWIGVVVTIHFFVWLGTRLFRVQVSFVQRKVASIRGLIVGVMLASAIAVNNPGVVSDARHTALILIPALLTTIALIVLLGCMGRPRTAMHLNIPGSSTFIPSPLHAVQFNFAMFCALFQLLQEFGIAFPPMVVRVTGHQSLLA
ncbi:hypothetical protein ccbrp13_13780 [Ktedonobacteria bacterium brp13]|nr:hypothetical protein ccbrp13_13780 [Ktedonobacteria bacterium brp13]